MEAEAGKQSAAPAAASGPGVAYRGFHLPHARLPITVQDLVVFLAIIETGSMTAAGKHLHVTPSAISQALTNLEKSLATPLLCRDVRPIVPTVMGRVIAERAASIVESMFSLVAIAEQGSNHLIPQLRIGMLTSLLSAIGPDIVMVLNRFVQNSIIKGGSHDIQRERFLSRAVDILITVADHDEWSASSRIGLLDEPYVLAIPVHYPDRIGSLSELASKVLIMHTKDTLTGRHVSVMLNRINLEPIRTVEFDHSDMVMSFVNRGLGWTIIPPLSVVTAQKAWSDTRFLPLPGLAMSRKIDLMFRPGDMGDIPFIVASKTVELLNEVVRPRIEERFPWLGEQWATADVRADWSHFDR
jgi:DNA-binding transcriptional LysR family regulator